MRCSRGIACASIVANGWASLIKKKRSGLFPIKPGRSGLSKLSVVYCPLFGSASLVKSDEGEVGSHYVSASKQSKSYFICPFLYLNCSPVGRRKRLLVCLQGIQETSSLKRIPQLRDRICFALITSCNKDLIHLQSRWTIESPC